MYSPLLLPQPASLLPLYDSASSLLLPLIEMAPSSLLIQNEIFLNDNNVLNNNNNDAWNENNENISLFLMHGKKKSQILEMIHGTKYTATTNRINARNHRKF